MLHLPGRVRLGGYVRELLQLERALERDGQADVAAEEEEERLVVEALRDRLDRVVAVEELLHPLRQLVQPVEDEVDLLLRQRPADLRELERKQAEQRDLGGERLRGRDRDLHAAAREERRLHLAGDLRPHEVRDRKRSGTALARELDGVDGVARLPRLRHADHERVLR